MKTTKCFGVVLEGDDFKAYELNELEGSGIYVHYVLMCTVAQINTVVKMLNHIKMSIQ